MAGMATGGPERTGHAVGLLRAGVPCRSARADPIGGDNSRELRREDQPHSASRSFESNAYGRRAGSGSIRRAPHARLRQGGCDRCGFGAAGSGHLDAGRSRGWNPARRRGPMVVGGRPRRDGARRSHSCGLHLMRRCKSSQRGARPSLLDAHAGPSSRRGSARRCMAAQMGSRRCSDRRRRKGATRA